MTARRTIVEPARPRCDVGRVDAAGRERDVQQRVHQGEVGARRHLQMQRRVAGGGRAPRVDDDQRSASLPLRRDPLHERWHRLGDVAADEQDRARLGEVRQRERQAAVDTERAVTRRRRGGHAEPAVVVDVRGAQRDPGELAELVGLLVGQPTAAEDGHSIRSVLLSVPDAGHDALESLVPADGDQRRVPAGTGQRGAQALRGVEQVGRRPPLPAQAAAIGREVARLDRDRVAVNAQVHAALQRAVRAVRRNGHCSTVGSGGSAPASGRLTARYVALSALQRPRAIRRPHTGPRRDVRASLHGCLAHASEAETWPA